MTSLDTGIAKRQTVEAMVAAYKSACEKVRNAYIGLEQAEQELKAGFNGGYFNTITRDVSMYSGGEYAANEIIAGLKKSAWAAIVNSLGIRKILSSKRADELSKNIDQGKGLPEIETDAILEMLLDIVGNSDNFAREAVMEVYDYLRPAANEYHKPYKTNERNARYDLGKKVILAWAVENRFDGGYRVNYYKSNILTAVDKVFHLLDGKPFLQSGYVCPLIDAINTANDGRGETEYFRFTCYQNRNLHLEFKRPDLVTKLNQIAGDNTSLKG